VLVEQPVNSGPNKFTDHVRNYTANSQLLSLANQSQQSVFVATALTSNAIARIPSIFLSGSMDGGHRAHFIRICTDIEINGKVKPTRLSIIERVFVKPS
jgi:hypothetical protein